MIVLLALHLIQVLLAGAYRAPREVNWWFGMALMFVTLGFSLTGYLLPWDQKGYWATKVATNIMGGAPVLGPYIQKVVVGGGDYGNQTLTRFYGLHVGVLPALFVLCLVGARRPVPPARPDRRRRKPTGRRASSGPSSSSWTRVASVAVFGVLVFLVLSEGRGQPRRPRRPVEPRLPGAARVVLPLAVPAAQVLPRQAGDRSAPSSSRARSWW